MPWCATGWRRRNSGKCEVQKGENPDHHFKSFAEQVQNFGLTKAEDRYLFLCFDKNDETFKFRVFVASR
jgi:hypothetical protein